jgi:DMSO/TMAO reductase YedYZ molybdopterin-dependent catalytic subunit
MAIERRTFIIGAVAGGIGLVEYGVVTGWMEDLTAPRGFSVKDFADRGEQAALLAITPNDDFYVTSKGATPLVRAADWRLKVDGLVDRPFELDYDELRVLPAIEKHLTLECISNSVDGTYIGNALWRGTALRPLIERARPRPAAAHVVLHAADGFTTGLPIDRFWNEENFLAWQMNGEDLPPNHGFPARIFIPGKFGMKQPKWLTRIEFVNKAYLGYWESQGWSDECERWSHARFTDLSDGAKISGKNFVITGYAVGNLDGIRKVEISFDNGESWHDTNLFSNPSPLTWSFWKYTWVEPRRGTYRLRVRSSDGQGRVQGVGPTSIFPDGATGQQVVKVTVV